MARSSFPTFRVSLVLEADGELCSYAFVSESKSQLPALEDLETTTPVKLIEIHITRVQDPEPPKPPRPRKQRRSKKQIPSTR